VNPKLAAAIAQGRLAKADRLRRDEERAAAAEKVKRDAFEVEVAHASVWLKTSSWLYDCVADHEAVDKHSFVWRLSDFVANYPGADFGLPALAEAIRRTDGFSLTKYDDRDVGDGGPSIPMISVAWSLRS
jgi:hypothetical protein